MSARVTVSAHYDDDDQITLDELIEIVETARMILPLDSLVFVNEGDALRQIDIMPDTA